MLLIGSSKSVIEKIIFQKCFLLVCQFKSTFYPNFNNFKPISFICAESGPWLTSPKKSLTLLSILQTSGNFKIVDRTIHVSKLFHKHGWDSTDLPSWTHHSNQTNLTFFKKNTEQLCFYATVKFITSDTWSKSIVWESMEIVTV